MATWKCPCRWWPHCRFCRRHLPSGRRVQSCLLNLADDDFAAVMRAQWAHFVRARPDLVNRAWPLISVWHDEDPVGEQCVEAARAVAAAALRAGQFELTGTALRLETDLFGALLTRLRSASAKSALGQFYTSPGLCDVIAKVLDLGDAETIHEPAAGTGGMLRAAAQAIRDNGRDPATITWYAVDVDRLAIACLAVNAVLWELGQKVILGVGDVLTNCWISRALAEREETIQVAAAVQHGRLFQCALHALDVLTDLTKKKISMKGAHPHVHRCSNRCPQRGANRPRHAAA